MRLFPAVKKLFPLAAAVAVLTGLPAAPVLAATTITPSPSATLVQQGIDNASPDAQLQAQVQAAMQQQGMPTSATTAQTRSTVRPSTPASPPAAPPAPEQKPMTQAELDERLKDKESAQYKADQLAEEAKRSINTFGNISKENEVQNVTGDPLTPATLDALQQIHKTYGSSYAVSDDLISEELALDMRRDSQREAALSYGARGGLAKRTHELLEQIQDYSTVLDQVFNFRQLLVKAPSGLLIEPPIVRETLDTLVIEGGGNEAAVADQMLKISKQAKIVAAPRDWRQYLVFSYSNDIPPPPRVLWPKNKDEQGEWNTWIKQGWEAGYNQGEEIFEQSLIGLVSDYTGMVRYRTLLAEGKVSQPFAMQEDRGVTGGGDEMRVGDRALKITGPSQFLTGAELWKPADR